MSLICLTGSSLSRLVLSLQTTPLHLHFLFFRTNCVCKILGGWEGLKLYLKPTAFPHNIHKCILEYKPHFYPFHPPLNIVSTNHIGSLVGRQATQIVSAGGTVKEASTFRGLLSWKQINRLQNIEAAFSFLIGWKETILLTWLAGLSQNHISVRIASDSEKYKGELGDFSLCEMSEEFWERIKGFLMKPALVSDTLLYTPRGGDKRKSHHPQRNNTNAWYQYTNSQAMPDSQPYSNQKSPICKSDGSSEWAKLQSSPPVTHRHELSQWET